MPQRQEVTTNRQHCRDVPRPATVNAGNAALPGTGGWRLRRRRRAAVDADAGDVAVAHQDRCRFHRAAHPSPEPAVEPEDAVVAQSPGRNHWNLLLLHEHIFGTNRRTNTRSAAIRGTTALAWYSRCSSCRRGRYPHCAIAHSYTTDTVEPLPSPFQPRPRLPGALKPDSTRLQASCVPGRMSFGKGKLRQQFRPSNRPVWPVSPAENPPLPTDGVPAKIGHADPAGDSHSAPNTLPRRRTIL